MANQYIHVGSITNAMRGKRLLESRGIRAYIHRSSTPAQEDGCGYSLLITDSSSAAEKFLRANGIRVIRVSKAL